MQGLLQALSSLVMYAHGLCLQWLAPVLTLKAVSTYYCQTLWSTNYCLPERGVPL